MSSLVVNPCWLAVLKAAIATAGALLLLSSYVAHRSGRLPRARKHRDALLLGLGIAAGLCWWNLGDFRARGYVHLWDTYHYYVGAKYFHEVGYERLYVCAAVADHRGRAAPISDRTGWPPASWQSACCGAAGWASGARR